MNIKKILLIICLSSQFTTTIFGANQAAWNQAFLAFGGGSTSLTAAASSIGLNRGTGLWSLNKDISDTLNTPESRAVGKYMSSGNTNTLKKKFPNAAPQAELLTALGVAKSGVSAPAATTPPVASAPGTPTLTAGEQQAKDDAAVVLKSEIESAEETYVMYLLDTNKASLVIEGTDLDDQMKIAKTVYNSYLADASIDPIYVIETA